PLPRDTNRPNRFPSADIAPRVLATMPPQVEDDGRGSGTTGRCPCPAENVQPIISARHLLSAAPCSSAGNRRCLQLLCDGSLPSMSPADRIANTNERVPHFAIIPP